MPGYIKLYRDILLNDLWHEKPFSRGQAWVDILLSANHEDKNIIFDGNAMLVKRGSFITSIRRLSDKWGWSRSKVCKFLTVISNEKMIVQNSDTKKTAITVINWDLYQCAKDTKEPQKRHRRATEKPQKSLNKNDKNDKEYNTPLYPPQKSPEKVYQENIGLLTPIVAESIKSYLDDGITEELIVKAITMAVENNKRSWRYISKILQRCLEEKILTVEQYEAAEIERDTSKVKANPRNKEAYLDSLPNGGYFDNDE